MARYRGCSEIASSSLSAASTVVRTVEKRSLQHSGLGRSYKHPDSRLLILSLTTTTPNLHLPPLLPRSLPSSHCCRPPPVLLHPTKLVLPPWKAWWHPSYQSQHSPPPFVNTIHPPSCSMCSKSPYSLHHSRPTRAQSSFNSTSAQY